MKNLVLIACLSLLLGCETSSSDIDPVDLQQEGNEESPEPTPAELEKEDWCTIWSDERPIVEELQEVKGEVIQLKECSGRWYLTGSSGASAPGRFNNYLNPCKLPEEFKEDGAEIILSGYVYGHTEDEELISFCGQPFQITEIKFKN